MPLHFCLQLPSNNCPRGRISYQQMQTPLFPAPMQLLFDVPLDEKRISDTIRKELLCVNKFLTSFKRVVESNEDIKIFNVTLGSKNKLGNYNVPTLQNYLAAVIVGDMD